jgi:hypothetical protein
MTLFCEEMLISTITWFHVQLDQKIWDGVYHITLWYFVTKIAMTYCEKKIVLVIKKNFLNFKAEGQEFAKILRSLEKFIQTVKGQNNFW